MRNYQVGYRLSDGRVRYCPLTHEEGMKYNSLQSDEERTTYIKSKIFAIKVYDALNRW